MKIKESLIVCVAMILLTAVHGQQVDISEKFTLTTIEEYDILNKYGDRILLFMAKGQDAHVRSLDENLHEVWKRELRLLGKRRRLSGVIPRADRFDMVYSFVEDGHRHLIVDQFDPGAARIDSFVLSSKINKNDTKDYELVVSEDKSHAFVYKIESDKIFKGYMIDFNLDTLKYEVALEVDDVKYSREFDQLLVSNYGEVFILFDKDNKRHRMKEHAIRLDVIRTNGEILKPQYIALDTFLNIHSAYVFDNDKRKITSVSVVHRDKSHTSEGYIYLNINPYNSTDITSRFTLYTEGLLKEYYRVDEIKKIEIEDLEIQDLVLREDGGVVILMESVRRIERNAYGFNSKQYIGYSSNVDYYYEDVLGISVDPNGDERWKRILRKKQYSYGDDGVFSSYGIFKTPSNLRLIFNDEIKRDNTVSEYAMNGNGTVRRYSVMSTQYEELGLRFSAGKQVSSNEIIVPSEVGNSLRMVRFIF